MLFSLTSDHFHIWCSRTRKRSAQNWCDEFKAPSAYSFMLWFFASNHLAVVPVMFHWIRNACAFCCPSNGCCCAVVCHSLGYPVCRRHSILIKMPKKWICISLRAINLTEMNKQYCWKIFFCYFFVPDWVVSFRWWFLWVRLERNRKSGVEVGWLVVRVRLPFDLYAHELCWCCWRWWWWCCWI